MATDQTPEPKKSSAASELARRLTIGTTAIVVLIVLVILSQWSWFQPIFAALTAIFAATALWEFYQMAEKKKLAPAIWMGIGAGIFFLLLNWIKTMGWWGHGASAFGLGIALFAIICYYLSRIQGGLSGIAVTIFGMMYVMIPLGLTFDILFAYPATYGTPGWWWFFLAVGTAVCTDIGAYFTGRAVGRKPLAPQLSPAKTWEGALGGVIAGTLFAVIWSLFDISQIEFWVALVLGIILSVVGQIGDLVESVFKRDAGVKDSNKIPGLGGLLDVVDSILFTLPVVYVAMRILIGAA